MNPFLRNVVIGVVGFLVAIGLGVLGLLNSGDPTFQVLAMLAGAVLATGVAVYLFIQAWRWSIVAYREGRTGRSVGVALLGGFIVLIAAGALSYAVILALLFFG